MIHLATREFHYSYVILTASSYHWIWLGVHGYRRLPTSDLVDNVIDYNV